MFGLAVVTLARAGVGTYKSVHISSERPVPLGVVENLDKEEATERGRDRFGEGGSVSEWCLLLLV